MNLLDDFPPGTELAGGWDEMSIWGDRMARVEFSDSRFDPSAFDAVRVARKYTVWLTDIPAHQSLLRTRMDFKYGNRSVTEQPFHYYERAGRTATGQLEAPVVYWIKVPKFSDLSPQEDSAVQRELKERGYREAWKYPLSAPKWKKLLKMSYEEISAQGTGPGADYEAINAVDEISGPGSWNAIPGVWATTKKGAIKFVVSRSRTGGI